MTTAIEIPKKRLSDEETRALEGRFIEERDIDFLVQGDTAVYKPDGSLLLRYLPGALSVKVCSEARTALAKAPKLTDNRGAATGRFPDGGLMKRRMVRQADGAVSNTRRAAREVSSGIIGYFDRYVRFPYCRATAFNLEHPREYLRALPFIREVDRLFSLHVPGRYAAQKAMIERTHPDFRIHGTAFTTMTVNKNFRTAAHWDAGDLPEGFGVMAALRSGVFDGSYTVWPQYGVGVDLRTRDVVLADVHELHANTAFIGKPGLYERLSVVLYYRRNMWRCGSAAEELERAKRRKPGDPLYD